MEHLSSLTKEELIVRLLKMEEVNRQQGELILFLQEEILALKKEIENLKNGGPKSGSPAKTEPPDWVKANTPPQQTQGPEKPKRKKRDLPFHRHREKTTQPDVIYACPNCPDCGRTLSGGSERSRRQIVELPEITALITDYLTYSRYCGVCHKNCVPDSDLSEVAVGQSRFGPNVHATVAYLRQMGRLPVRVIATVLSSLCHLKISAGEVIQMLHTVARYGKGAYTALQSQLRLSPYVNGDETGWREGGQNGHLWSFSTPWVRFFVYPKTRAGHVVTDVLGTDYPGIVVSDFYGGYNSHFGLHQRCWVHLLRDVHDLKKKYPLPGVLQWAEALRTLYDRAKEFRSDDPKIRSRARVGFQEELYALAFPYAASALPQHTLCERLLTFESEMFTFVEHPDVPSENNAAERSVRPRVVARKISGGTRSPAGSKTMAVLSSLFATWEVRKEDALKKCREMLREAQQLPAAAPA